MLHAARTMRCNLTSCCHLTSCAPRGEAAAAPPVPVKPRSNNTGSGGTGKLFISDLSAGFQLEVPVAKATNQEATDLLCSSGGGWHTMTWALGSKAHRQRDAAYFYLL